MSGTLCRAELEYWTVVRSQMPEQTKLLRRIATALESLVKDKARAEREFNVGDRVLWKDPEYGEETAGWKIVDVAVGGMYSLLNDDGSEARAYVDEIRPDRRPDKAGEMKAAGRPDAPETRVCARTVLVVDDERFMAGYVKKFMPDAIVTYYRQLPEDESVLSQFDALVIDGEGIGNKKWKHGLDFCKAYDKPEGQSVVFHSGLCAHGDDATELERRGIANIPKGGSPEKLVLNIRFPMAKKVGGAK